MKETDLAQKFISYLSCYDLYFEVNTVGGCVDIVASAPPLKIAYEVKTTFNFKVIEQAARNTENFHYSYVCVPHSRDIGFQLEVCKKFGVGVLVCRYPDSVLEDIYEAQKPRLNRKAWAKRVYLHDFQKRSVAGTASADRITPFKITVENIERHVRRHPGCTMKEMIKEIHHHYHTDTSAISSLYQWMRQGVIKEVVLKEGKLYLSEVIE